MSRAKRLRLCAREKLLSVVTCFAITIVAGCQRNGGPLHEKEVTTLEEKAIDASLSQPEIRALKMQSFNAQSIPTRDYLTVRCKLDNLGSIIGHTQKLTLNGAEGAVFVIFFSTTTGGNTLLNYIPLTNVLDTMPAIHTESMSEGGEIVDFYPTRNEQQLGEKQFVVAIIGDYEGGQCFYADCFYAEAYGQNGPRIVRMSADTSAPIWLSNRSELNRKWCALARKSPESPIPSAE